MKRILFVDDEPAVLGALKDVLFRDRKRWEMVFADSGEAALEIMSKSPVDVLVSDMQMPCMNGLDLLKRVRRDHPQVIRLSISGYTDLESFTLASAVAHQQLAKPCDARALREKLEHACALHDVLESASARRLIGSLGPLPSAPRVYRELTLALGDPNTPMKRLAAIVEQDIGLAGRVLKLVNSAYYGNSRPIGNLEEAIVRLGINALRHIVLSSEVFGALVPANAAYCGEDLESHALLSARIAQKLMHQREHREAAFIAGLLHDAGKLLLASLQPAACAEASRRARAEQITIEAAERAVFGADHAEAGAYLLGLWGLPAQVFQAVRSHHDPIPVDGSLGDGSDLAIVVRVADALAAEVVRTQTAAPRSVPPPASASASELSAALARWWDLAIAEAGDLAAARA